MKSNQEKINLSSNQTNQLAQSTEKYIIAWADSVNYPIPFTVSFYKSGYLVTFFAILIIVICAIVTPISLIVTIPLFLWSNVAWVQQFNEIFNKWINEENYEKLPQSVRKFRPEFQDSQKSENSSFKESQKSKNSSFKESQKSKNSSMGQLVIGLKDNNNMRNYQGSEEYRLMKKNNPHLFKTQAEIDRKRKSENLFLLNSINSKYS